MYDGVILAAGRNTRLKGVVPSYHKPLVIVNGRPLIVTLTKNMLKHCETVTVVVSPENCGPIVELLADNDLMDLRVNIVVQPTARGPGEGLYRGLMCATQKRILMACGDNVIPLSDFDLAVERDYYVTGGDADRHSNLVTVSTTLTDDEQEALRFTRVKETHDQFLENEPGGLWQDGYYHCWIGPLIFDRLIAQRIFKGKIEGPSNNDTEIKISKAFNIHRLLINTVKGNSIDIGTADALVENVE